MCVDVAAYAATSAHITSCTVLPRKPARDSSSVRWRGYGKDAYKFTSFFRFIFAH
jgi:hypothetical protein